ncbi:unnamed protein product [Paramecium sonneborni]|uniref:PX domain-containing protein n=1 Tax=Paramecium sonneborni TaxID=65129 RepID=A0A8S1LRY8_9CILI|nr:unnamed protein product [Paramecium sonneborni]
MQQDQIDWQQNLNQQQINQQEQEKQQNDTNLLNQQQQLISNEVSQLNKNQKSIVIEVSNPIEIKKSKLKHYLVYTIKGIDAWGEFQTQRRYKEFYALRLSLIQFWTGFYIPSLPDKIVNPNKDQQNERLRLLNHFVQRISQLEYLYYSVQFAKIFLRSNEKKICKILKGLTPPSLLYQIQTSKQVFKITQEQYNQQMLNNQLQNIQMFLQSSRIILNKLSDQTQSIINNNKKLKKQIQTQLEQSEKLILQDKQENEEERNTLYEIDLQIKSNLNNFIINRDMFLEQIHDLIKIEQNDIEAYLEGIYLREKIVSQQNIEKIKLKYWQFEKKENDYLYLNDPIRRKYNYESNNNEIENHIKQCKKEINVFNHFNLFMISLTVTYVFEQFKKDKNQFYQRIIKQIAKLQLENLSFMQQLWGKIGNLAQIQRQKNEELDISIYQKFNI